MQQNYAAKVCVTYTYKLNMRGQKQAQWHAQRHGDFRE